MMQPSRKRAQLAQIGMLLPLAIDLLHVYVSNSAIKLGFFEATADS